MRERHTNDSEFSYLRTPASSDGAHSGPNQRDSSGHPSLSMQLLRTPAASEAERGHQPEDKARARGGQVRMLPTVTVADTFTDKLKSSQQKEGSMHSVNLGQAVHMAWGKFEPAVKRWEAITGMKAPNPTKPDGKDGGQRLSSEFTEWMMGLKPGWVTGHGLSRKDELKACGNGVVPQQAKLALGILLGRIS